VYEALLTPVLETTDREVRVFTDKQHVFETLGMIREKYAFIYRCVSLEPVLAGSMLSFMEKIKST
jgi:hypothetical protein